MTKKKISFLYSAQRDRIFGNPLRCKINELEKDLQKINDADQKWDFDALDKLIKKYNNTTYEEIKEALYDLVISFRFQFMEAYESMTETEDMIDLLRSAIRCNDQLIALKPALNLELEKNQWHMMIADLVTDNSEKEKWLQEFYHKLEKAPKIFAKEL
jgi:hypothetical protein